MDTEKPGVPRSTIKIGVMDEERRTTVNLMECIRAVKDRLPCESHTIIDAPPGSSCGPKAAIEHATHALLVSEPTPFGLHDLKLAVDLCGALGVPTAAVINRADIGDDQVREFLAREEIPLLAEIPLHLDIRKAADGGAPIVVSQPDSPQAGAFRDLAKTLISAGKA